jgi:hypothetical protein
LEFNQSGNGDSRAPDRPNLTPGFSGPFIIGTQKQWFIPAAFQLPASGTYGNAGRDIIEGPGLLSFDSSLFKNFRVRERADVQFRAEFFNILNHANFNNPSASVTAGAFGSITSAADPRIGQLAIKVLF